MDVKDFVTETLKQIIEGVREAQVHAAQNDAYVAREKGYYGDPTGETKEQDIAFDIAVTIQKSRDKEGAGGLKIPFIEAGGGINVTDANSSVSRIRFTVPIMLPAQKLK